MDKGPQPPAASASDASAPATDNAPPSKVIDSDSVNDQVTGGRLRWPLALIALAAVVAAVAFVWSRGSDDTSADAPVRWDVNLDAKPLGAELPSIPFTDITEEAGVYFRHVNGAAGEKLMPEAMGSGCAFFDFDNDGNQDLLLLNFNYWPNQKPEGAAVPTMRLFKNDGTGHFNDVTAGSGLEVPLYGMGVAAGDYDGDGRGDLFITTLYENHLYRNLGSGRFEDVTAQARLSGNPDDWSTSAGWFDYDNDGDLDLFVCNYVRWDREFDLAQDFRPEGATERTYVSPLPFPGSYCYLYRNEGDGTFTDVSEAAGIQINDPVTGKPSAKALGVAPVDVDRDGWIDLFVANDGTPNFFFHNLGNGKFEEIAHRSNVALSQQGQARAGMGIDAGYFRNTNALGFIVGNFGTETSGLFVAQQPDTDPLNFEDETYITGIGVPSRLVLTFGIFFIDCDLDGRLDIVAANGHIWETDKVVHESQKYRQPAHLYWNAGDPEHLKDYVLMPREKCGPDLTREILGRGATYADIDGDGDLDLLITDNNFKPLLLRNDQQLGHHWLRFQLTGTRSNTEATGAWIEVTLGDKVLRRQVMPTRSYLSQVELPVTIGIGTRSKVDGVRVTWPDGSVQVVDDVQIDGVTHVTQK